MANDADEWSIVVTEKGKLIVDGRGGVVAELASDSTKANLLLSAPSLLRAMKDVTTHLREQAIADKEAGNFKFAASNAIMADRCQRVIDETCLMALSTRRYRVAYVCYGNQILEEYNVSWEEAKATLLALIKVNKSISEKSPEGSNLKFLNIDLCMKLASELEYRMEFNFAMAGYLYRIKRISC